MTPRTRADVLARLGLTCAAVLPYWRFLTFQVIFVTDDYFASDIFNGELPGRVLVGQVLRSGHWPAWTNRVCSGYPLVGSPSDPIGLMLFTLLPPAAALDALVIVLLLIAAHGAYSLARRLEADIPGALLAGIAFAGCGYIAAQLKHLSIVSTIVWLPVGLLLLDRAFAAAPPETRSARARDLALFGIVFAVQALCGFPQSAYICALVYGPFALFRALQHRTSLGSRHAWMKWLVVAGIAIVLGAMAGAVVMLPLAKLGAISDRSEPLGWDWATRLAYWPRNVWMFLFPYANGDISNNTYQGPPFFWEDYSYLGILTFVLAFYGAVRGRRRPAVTFVTAMALVGYLFVLGRATPVYGLAFTLIPGISMFRFPTRFLFVVELGIALLGGVGLTRLREHLARRWPDRPLVATAISVAIVVLTVIDLFVHQPRQNPVVPADTWLAPPASVALVHDGTPQPRTFTPRHRDLHRHTFQRASGWADVQPYFEERDLLAPDLGGAFWNTASGDCYVGISPRWFVDVWGDHNREGSIAAFLASLDFRSGELRVHPRLATFLRIYGITHLLSPYPLDRPLLPFAGRTGSAYVYRVDGSARVRFVSGARTVSDDKQAVSILLAADFDPAREIVLHDAPPDLGRPSAATEDGRATIVSEDQRSLVIQVVAPADGFLLVADTFYPGWTASVDGRPTAIYRANMSVRGLQVPAGAHEIRLEYEPPGFRLGLVVSITGLVLLALWLTGALWLARRVNGHLIRPIHGQ